MFRAPILISRVKPVVTSWKSPSPSPATPTVICKAVEYRVPGKGKAELVFTDENGVETSRQTIFQFSGPGVVQAMHNRDDSILSFARCFSLRALRGTGRVVSPASDTISKDYDQTFKLLFQKVYDEEYQDRPLRRRAFTYRYALIDDVAGQGHPLPGGIIWACKNYDGDVMSAPPPPEAAHGTVIRSLLPLAAGRGSPPNPLATMAAWAGALRKRGEWDKNQRLVDYSDRLKQAGLDVL